MHSLNYSKMFVATCMATAAVLLAPEPSLAAFKQIKDASTLCNFAQDCTVSLDVPENDVVRTFSISRLAVAGSKPVLKFALPNPSKVTTAVSISVDGKPVLSIAVGDFAKTVDHDEGEEWSYGSKENVTRLLEALKSGSKVEIRIGDSSKSATVSLAGFAAALIFADEQQDRAGTVDALQAKGTKAAPPSPQVKAIDKVGDIPAAIRADFTTEGRVCSRDSADIFRFGGGFSAQMGDNLNLIGLPCGAPGAYNQPFVFYSEQGGTVTPLMLPVMADESPSTADNAWNIDWSQKTRTVTAFFKGRGLGDCGTYNVWKAEDTTDGVRFVLQEERVKSECDGNYADGPTKWPAAWPLKK